MKKFIATTIIQYMNESKSLSYDEYMKKINKNYKYFLRITDDTNGDIERNFSCNTNAWFEEIEDAIEYQESENINTEIKKDIVNNLFCANVEDGLSGFVIENEVDFRNIINKLKSVYGISVTDIAVFKSKNYKLNSGTDGEDLFKDADFLFYLKTDRYSDFVNNI